MRNNVTNSLVDPGSHTNAFYTLSQSNYTYYAAIRKNSHGKMLRRDDWVYTLIENYKTSTCMRMRTNYRKLRRVEVSPKEMITVMIHALFHYIMLHTLHSLNYDKPCNLHKRKFSLVDAKIYDSLVQVNVSWVLCTHISHGCILETCICTTIQRLLFTSSFILYVENIRR